MKPILPLIEDMWAHAFDESYHLHHVHDKFGNHHVEKEMANTPQENNHNASRGSCKSEDQVSFHVLPVASKGDFNGCELNEKYHASTFGKLPYVLISIQVPPPKFS